ncbi:hypothetical protein K0U83_03855 [bacterium]|jgi:hypothetical protein|nr:hypothetical protein [bacterium]
MDYGVTTRQAEAASTTVGIVGSVAGVPSTAGAVAGMMAAAGASSAAPVVGWVVAGGLALASGIISLVQMFKQRRIRESQAIQIAQQLGIPEAASVPGWIFEALKMTPSRRTLEARRIEKQLSRGGTLRNPVWRSKTKLAILGAIELVEMADKRSRAGLRPIPPTVAEVKTIMARTEQIKRRNKMAEYARMGVVVGGIALLGYAALSD